jgi:hypothetical protein
MDEIVVPPELLLPASICPRLPLSTDQGHMLCIPQELWAFLIHMVVTDFRQRWSSQARQWAHVDAAHLNPDTPQIKEPESTQKAA